MLSYKDAPKEKLNFLSMEIVLLSLFISLLGIFVGAPVVFLFHIFGWALTGVPYIAVPKSVLDQLPTVLSLTKDSVFYDLGCGDGRVLHTLARNSEAQFIGIEKAPVPYVRAKMWNFFSREKNVHIMWGDIRKISLENATHIFTYLGTHGMQMLVPKFEKELRPGTVLVSCDFPLKQHTPEKTLTIGEAKKEHTVYIYTF